MPEKRLQTISLTTARRLAVRATGLTGGRPPRGKEGVARVVEHLGYVQIDTIAVVQRAHHHTLWARTRDYDPEMLHELQARDRRVFEYWAHAAAYVPMRDYRFYLHRMHWEARGGGSSRWLQGNRAVADGVLDRIRTEGALMSADFADTRGEKRGPWWDWKPAKRALEAMFSTGELMVTERRNFQRVYDLAERVLPADVDMTEPTAAEQARYLVSRVIRSMGLVSLDHTHWHVKTDNDGFLGALAGLVDAGEVVPVRVRGLGADRAYAHAASLRGARRAPTRKAVHLLSPFDNLTIWRGWLRTLFGFDFKLECYTPAAKRRWGYFCLPILWGGRFVGRLDPKADRKKRVLIVRKLIFEPDFTDHDALFPALAAKLHDFAAFNGCDRVKVEKSQPAKFAAPLRRELADGAR